MFVKQREIQVSHSVSIFTALYFLISEFTRRKMRGRLKATEFLEK